MARVQYKKPRVKKVKVPKPVAPPKPERPKRGDLKHIYKELLTTDTEQRINALCKAMAWYDKVQAYLAYKNGGKWTTKQLRMMNNAQRDRLHGIASIKPETKERCFKDAITSYEVMVSSYKTPKISLVHRKLKSSKSTLNEHLKNMQKKYKKFILQLQEALQFNIQVNKLTSDYRIGHGGVTLDRRFLANLKKLTHKHGLLTAVIQLLPILSEAMSIYNVVDNDGHKTGKIGIDYQARYEAVLKLITDVNKYAQKETAPRTIARRKKIKKVKKEAA